MAARTTVFVVGAARSGTTYLQNLLGGHPLVVTSQETDLFARYLAAWRRAWEWQLPADEERWRRQRHRGLPAVLTEGQFDALLAEAVERVHAATYALKPGATVLVDKTPSNVLHGELILRTLPEARFVHVIRDGRDVVCSLLRASGDWGREWAASTPLEAALAWRREVAAGRAIAELTGAYTEVRYEELRGERGPELLRELLAFCGVEAPAAACEAIVDAHALAPDRPPGSSIVWGGEVVRRLGGPPGEPEGFAGSGGVGVWRTELGVRAQLVVERQAGTLLRELGYADGAWPALGALERTVALGRLAVERAGRRARLRLRGALEA